MKHDKVYLVHISECIDRIERYTKDGRTAFTKSTLIQDGVIRNLQTLGQSVVKISDSLKERHPEVDWRNIIGFRNVAAHAYFAMKWPMVWVIATEQVPKLRSRIAAILDAASDE